MSTEQKERWVLKDPKLHITRETHTPYKRFPPPNNLVEKLNKQKIPTTRMGSRKINSLCREDKRIELSWFRENLGGQEWKKRLKSKKANQILDKLAGSILPGPACWASTADLMERWERLSESLMYHSSTLETHFFPLPKQDLLICSGTSKQPTGKCSTPLREKAFAKFCPIMSEVFQRQAHFKFGLQRH